MKNSADRRDKSGGHIVIAGTGRAGTTFLVELLTRLGFDTGFAPDRVMQEVNAVSKAGLEMDPGQPWLWPYVVKSPGLSLTLGGLLRDRAVRVKLVLLPVRSPEEAVASRMRVWRQGESRGGLWLVKRRGLWPFGKESRQALALLRANHRLLCTIAEHRLPHIMLHFPTVVRDGGYLHGVLRPVLDAHGVEEAEFADAFAAVARPELVHSV